MKFNKQIVFDIFLILTVGGFFCFYQLGRNTFGAGDQTIHARVVQEMFYSGDYFRPRVHTEPYYNKPPLKMWLSQIPLHVLGETNLAYRFLDGLSGVLMGLFIYFFSFKLFNRRILSLLSSLFLLGCPLFYFGHGVRNAVQDSMMHLFMMVALYYSYFSIQLIDSEAKQEDENILRMALKGSAYTAAGIMCKGLGGAIVYPIIGVYALLRGGFFKLLQKGWKIFLLVFVLSFVPLALYILQFGQEADNVFRMLFVSEGLKRAVKGYHHTKHIWYYWKEIVTYENTVPLVSLVVGLFYVIKKSFNKDKLERSKHLFVLSWALVPIMFYQLVKSKLPWYIIPSLGGMSIVSACGVTYLLDYAKNLSIASFQSKFKKIFAYVLAITSLVYLSSHYADFVRRFLEPYTPDRIGVMAQSNKIKNADNYMFDMPRKLGMHENFYLRMLKAKPVSKQDVLNAVSNSNDKMVVFSELGPLVELARVKEPIAMQVFPPKFRRLRWIGALAYNFENENVKGFEPWCESVRASKSMVSLGTGWLNYAGIPNGVLLRGTKGSKARVELKGNYFMREVGAKITMKIGSTLSKSSKKPLTVKAYLNESFLGEVKIIPSMDKHVVISKSDAWNLGTNILTMEIYDEKGQLASDSDKLILMEEVKACPNTN